MSGPERSQATEAPGVPHAERRALLATCVAAAARGAEVVRAGAADRAGLAWEAKSPADFVSEVDRASEHVIATIVRERHPDARMVGEELSPDAAADLRGLAFIADPLDGTTNFLHGFPWYAVSVGAAVDGALVAGAVVNVPTGELFTATASDGARRNGEPIRVSTETDPARSLLGTGFPFKHREHIGTYLESLPRLMRATAGIRRPGAAALDLTDVACGRFEAFWELMLAPWDIAAGTLIVREAGGLVTDLEGRPAPVAHGPIVAGNPAMHAWLLEQLRAPHSS
ncbi:MAG TPA: inositol monophosphatase family protein [Gemmatimonadaceae bacterium]|jgi:myo-inositol-1(or 4)-monophosphatase|nr:inositol monophosphatase family protein [Gemmatimonadaceae bacterium]